MNKYTLSSADISLQSLHQIFIDAYLDSSIDNESETIIVRMGGFSIFLDIVGRATYLRLSLSFGLADNLPDSDLLAFLARIGADSHYYAFIHKKRGSVSTRYEVVQIGTYLPVFDEIDRRLIVRELHSFNVGISKICETPEARAAID